MRLAATGLIIPHVLVEGAAKLAIGSRRSVKLVVAAAASARLQQKDLKIRDVVVEAQRLPGHHAHAAVLKGRLESALKIELRLFSESTPRGGDKGSELHIWKLRVRAKA